MDQQAPEVPQNRPEAPALPEDEAPKNEHAAYPASVGQAVGFIVAGLLPCLGIAVGLWWAYAGAPAQKRTLAVAAWCGPVRRATGPVPVGIEAGWLSVSRRLCE